jgi:hypothetical protein
MSKKRKRTYVLYDGRACQPICDTDNATVLVACESLNEARSYKGEFGQMTCYSYRNRRGGLAKDERWEWDYFPENTKG